LIRRVPHLPLAIALATVTATLSCGSSKTPGAAGNAGAGATAGQGATAGAGATAGQGAASGSNAGAGGTLGQAGTGSGGASGAAPLPQAPLSKFIVVDQFGYRPEAEKIAVLRDPQMGYDAADAFAPGKSYALIEARTGESVLSAAPVAWNGGMTDPSSGDKAWSFDFSSVKVPGTYYVLDADNGARSDLFNISDTVYREILKRAVRTFFYQRVGQAKDAKWVGEAWADVADHVGPGQDHNARLFSAKTDASTEKDLWGGWFDAGDFNKYTNWTAAYVVSLLHAYLENKAAWSDDYEIPESGNGIPDVLDEAKWGLDYLGRLQNADGSVLSIVGEGGGSPPSAAKDPSYYGPASTSATLSTAAAYALGATVLGSLGNAALTTYASDLKGRATKAWAWADANPSVVFKNNDTASGSSNLGSGQQETRDDYGRAMMKLEASAYLFQVTQEAQYQAFFDANYKASKLVQGSTVTPWEAAAQLALLYYTSLPSATAAVKADILKAYGTGLGGGDNLAAHSNKLDPYGAYLKDYTWASNSVKSIQGSIFFDSVTYGVDPSKDGDARLAAERYVHYVHGVNPLGFVYLSNMFGYGAITGVTTFFHTWYAHGSTLWEKVGVSKYGPPPGFLTGGPNPSYAVDACCAAGCGAGFSCTSEPLSPPTGQPPQKSYKDFNTSWPIDSWSVTENSDGYQANYIRLLSKFVK
jgi:endoglucanase